MSNILNILSEDAFISKIDETNSYLKAICKKMGIGHTPSSWKEIQDIVRSGKAQDVFSVGDQLISNRNGIPIVWDIIGFNHDSPVASGLNASMTLLMHNPITYKTFCEPEAMYHPFDINGLQPGTYEVKLPDENGKTYHFKMNYSLSYDGQLVYNGTSFLDNPGLGKIYSYSDSMTDYIQETIQLFESGITPNDGTLEPLNNAKRIAYGSNVYHTSSLSRYLNEYMSDYQKRYGLYSRENSTEYLGEDSALRFGFDEDFLSVLGKVQKFSKEYPTSGSKDNACINCSEDFFFPLSIDEVFGKEYSGEAIVYPFFQEYSDFSSAANDADSNRVRTRRNGKPCKWWLRSQDSDDPSQVHIVTETGEIGSARANDPDVGVLVACCIV